MINLIFKYELDVDFSEGMKTVSEAEMRNACNQAIGLLIKSKNPDFPVTINGKQYDHTDAQILAAYHAQYRDETLTEAEFEVKRIVSREYKNLTANPILNEDGEPAIFCGSCGKEDEGINILDDEAPDYNLCEACAPVIGDRITPIEKDFSDALTKANIPHIVDTRTPEEKAAEVTTGIIDRVFNQDPGPEPAPTISTIEELKTAINSDTPADWKKIKAAFYKSLKDGAIRFIYLDQGVTTFSVRPSSLPCLFTIKPGREAHGQYLAAEQEAAEFFSDDSKHKPAQAALEIDQSVCIESECSECGHQGLGFDYTYTNHVYRAYSVCPNCNDRQEF
jgi:hypothetical protein